MSQSGSSKVTCFVCGSPTVVTNEGGRNLSGEGGANLEKGPAPSFDDSEQQRQKRALEHSVFVIKSLFQVPEFMFLNNENASLVSRDGKLQVLGFCRSCSESVEKARTIYGDLLKAMQLFRTIQHQIVEKVKGGGGRVEYDGDPALETWRQFICNNPYDNSNTFLLEDCSPIVETLLTALQANTSSFTPPLPQVNVKEDAMDASCGNSVEYLELDKLSHLHSNDSVEMKNQSDSLMDEEEEEKPIDPNNDEFELLVEDDNDFEGYSSEEEKALPSDMTVSEDETDVKVEKDPLEINDDDEFSAMSSGIGNIVSTRTLRSGKRMQYGEPSDDPLISSSEDNSNSGSTIKLKNLTDPKRKHQKQRRKPESTKPAPFSCTKSGCLNFYFKKKSLLGHLEKDHNEKQFPFKCWTCDESFQLENQMTAHVSTEHPHSFFPCQQCPKYFKKEANLKYHITCAHSKPPSSKKKLTRSEQKCPQPGCTKICQSMRSLKFHLNVTHNIKPVKSNTINCTVDGCDKTFKSTNGLSKHLNAVHNIPSSRKLKSFKCPEENCGKTYRNSDNLKVHIYKDHKKEPLYKCESCDASFFTRVQLRRHQDIVHLQDKSFICDICTKNYTSGSGLWHHRKLIHGVNQSTPAEVISELAAAFRNKIPIPKEKLFPCRVDGCNKAFGTYVGLRSHVVLIHRKDSRFKCKPCNLNFPERRLLTKHEEMVHISGSTPDGKAFMCETCGDGFTCTEFLKLHQSKAHGDIGASKSDDGDNDGICEVCGKTFANKNSLYMHYRGVHKKKLVCEICGKSFPENRKFRHHLYVKHKIGTEEDKTKQCPREGDRRCKVVNCRKKFWGAKAEENFKRHMEEEHGGEDGKKMKFECEECGKGFGDETKFEEHRLLHLNKDSKPFKCEMCGKGFPTRGYLRYHELNTHKAPRKFARKKETKPRDRKYMKKKKKE